MKNLEIRNEAKAHGVKLWEVAEVLGITDSAFSRKLRRELPGDQRKHVLLAIEQAAKMKREASA